MKDSPFKSREAECAVIYHLSQLRDPTSLFGKLRATDFAYDDTAKMYDRMSVAFHKGRKLQGDATVMASVAPFMADMGAAMGDWSVAAENVLMMSQRRRVAETMVTASEKIHDFSISKAELEDVLYRLAEDAMDERSTNDGEISVDDAVKQTLARIEHRLRNDELRLSLGIPLLDRMQRFSPGNLLTIAARPSVGKTALSIAMLRGMLKRGLRVGFICMEMTPEEIVSRILSQETSIPYTDLDDGRFHPDDLAGGIAELQHWETENQLFLSCGNSEFTAPQCRQLMKRWRHKQKVDIIIIDYLQRFAFSRRHQSPKERAEEAIEMAKGVAKDESIGVIMLAQLNRASQDQSKSRPVRPRLHHIKDASRIEEESDAVWLLWKPDREVEFIAEDTEWPNLQPTGSDNQVALNLHKMAIFGDKNRNGAPWKHYLTMHAQTMEYREQ